jgi:hypothetical protein
MNKNIRVTNASKSPVIGGSFAVSAIMAAMVLAFSRDTLIS